MSGRPQPRRLRFVSTCPGRSAPGAAAAAAAVESADEAARLSSSPERA